MQNNIRDLKERAEELYKNGQYLCSEAIFVVVNEYLGEPVPPEAVKLASGFPVGMGGAGCACGALTGGIMALGLRYGRTQPGQEVPDMFPKAKELHDWFEQEFASTCCRVIIQHVEFGKQAHIEQCTRITGAVAEKVLQMI